MIKKIKLPENYTKIVTVNQGSTDIKDLLIERIRVECKNNGITHEELGNFLGFKKNGRAHVSNILNTKNSSASVETLINILNKLEVQISISFGRDNE